MTVARIGPKEVLTVDDVPELPNGMATIVTVRTNEGKNQADARIDDYGRLRAPAPGHVGEYSPPDQRQVRDR